MFKRTCLAGLRQSQRLSTLRHSNALSTLAIIEHQNGTVQPATLTAITAATKLGGSIHALLAGSGTKELADKVAKIAGVEKVLFVDNAAYDRGLPESWAPMLVENVRKGGYTHVLCAHSAFGKNMLPRAAALLDVMQVSDIVGIEGEDTFTRPIYAGNAIATIQTSDKIKLVTVRGTAYDPAETEGGSGTVEAASDPEAASSTTWKSEALSKSERPELSGAARIVSGGRGVKDKENFDKLIIPLADALGAAVGASRAAVDSGYADNSLQVGQTGKVVAPELYIAVGISGAIQHLAGMKDSKVIGAINKDGDAPIFQIADVGLVADLFNAVPELTKKVQA
ncbi:Electron transfer flavoprotein alpha-subunit, mitochondrial [Taphrina deformans PYCC 5710]|uniref:Probable electron transfer flavoprotein subunit alpha n=1 Tax=Taphrina deformans (strain PYCC 5710 / ATCC 11124 / CBS 356.35 / IMI 108563 / JCM 9778 / NBRC 8474) TaxID=1097556 RepID=R4X781_TAPDE|nr:Electron transfer flavoprotein alpha-subunit, mitochondrial [Taphrina deformans PYCC 5710]|eukprot:CCG81167.1 Electron transfer flavoprotein alpha-subunit, mitochondrial [Taphrina deformans PYCC 5710]